MPKVKFLRKKKNPTNSNGSYSDKKFFEKIKEEIVGLEKETFMRRILTKLAINPDISNLWFSLGLLLSEAELYEIANNVFDKVVILNPDHRKLWTSKANALCQLGRHDEASECYKKSLESFTGQLDGYNDLSELRKEVRESKKLLGLEEFDDDAIEFLTTNILDLDSFISELEAIADPIEGEKESADNLSSKLDELEKIGRPQRKPLTSSLESDEE
jgi:tetratricopeptide (TPR) repeat protein